MFLYAEVARGEQNMFKKLGWVFACSAIGSIVSFTAQAFPFSPPPEHPGKPDVMLVRNFCGLGFHRSVYGYCVRNGTPYGYAPPVVVALPVVVAPPVVGPICPYGYHFGPYGRCIPW